MCNLFARWNTNFVVCNSKKCNVLANHKILASVSRVGNALEVCTWEEVPNLKVLTSQEKKITYLTVEISKEL